MFFFGLKRKAKAPSYHRDVGPFGVFHATTRVGRGRTAFGVLKVRTMAKGAHKKKAEVHATGDSLEKFKADDPRITWIGKLLRKMHADEVPQLPLVLSGKLRLVGIRPLLKREYDRLPTYAKRIYDEMGPGMLGLQYVCSPFPPTKKQFNQMIRQYYMEWKKKPKKTAIKYALKILANKASGRAPSK